MKNDDAIQKLCELERQITDSWKIQPVEPGKKIPAAPPDFQKTQILRQLADIRIGLGEPETDLYDLANWKPLPVADFEVAFINLCDYAARGEGSAPELGIEQLPEVRPGGGRRTLRITIKSDLMADGDEPPAFEPVLLILAVPGKAHHFIRTDRALRAI